MLIPDGAPGMFKYDAMQRRSISKGFNNSPLNQGLMSAGTDNIRVKLIGYPDDAQLKQVLAKMVVATTGADITLPTDPAVAEELFSGGLQTGLEAYTFVFEISGISRALTHELVRTRKGIFHQQSMRHTDMGDAFNVRMPLTIERSDASVSLSTKPYLRALAKLMMLRAQASKSGDSEHEHPVALPDLTCEDVYAAAIEVVREAYSVFKAADIPYQDARFVCPIGTQTYIVATYPIKVFLDTYAYRSCNMMMWEIVWLFREMGKLVVDQFPWMAPHIKIGCERSKRCNFQGWENTAEQCDGGGYGDGSPFSWAGDRTFKSERFGG